MSVRVVLFGAVSAIFYLLFNPGKTGNKVNPIGGASTIVRISPDRIVQARILHEQANKLLAATNPKLASTCALPSQWVVTEDPVWCLQGDMKAGVQTVFVSNGWQQLRRCPKNFKKQVRLNKTIAIFAGATVTEAMPDNYFTRWDKFPHVLGGTLFINYMASSDMGVKWLMFPNMQQWAKETGHSVGFLPRTYMLPEECSAWVNALEQRTPQQRQGNDLRYWMLKPAEKHLGEGIQFLDVDSSRITDPTDAEFQLGEHVIVDEGWCRKQQSAFMQEYVDPYLVDNKKIEARTLVAVISTQPWVVMFRPTMWRRCGMRFNFSDHRPEVHVCNVHQHSGAEYADEQDLVWSTEQIVRNWVSEGRFDNLEAGWDHIELQSANIALSVLDAHVNKLGRHRSTGQMFGFDFVAKNSDLSLKLLEVNPNPGVWGNFAGAGATALSIYSEGVRAVMQTQGNTLGEQTVDKPETELNMFLSNTTFRDGVPDPLRDTSYRGWRVLYDERWGRPPFFWDVFEEHKNKAPLPCPCITADPEQVNCRDMRPEPGML